MEEKPRLAQAAVYVGSVPYNSNVEPAPRLLYREHLGQPEVLFDVTYDSTSYRLDVSRCRFFYKYDPIASPVVNRMADMSSTQMKLKRNNCSDVEMAFYRAVLMRMQPLWDACMLDYLVTGMAVPDYTTSRIMGNRLDPALGRTRYWIPDSFWVRNPDCITLKRRPMSLERSVFVEVSQEEVHFITNEGVYRDGTEDREAYQSFARQFPQYVQKIKDGVREIHLPNARAILRKPMSNSDYPQPFLVAALSALEHKMRIKQMDYSIATRVLEAILHVKVGSDDYPVVEGSDAITDIDSKLRTRDISKEPLFRLVTNHTIEMGWVMPPVDTLLSDEKFQEPNSDIFLALGFSRKLLVGEALRSNAGQDSQSYLGPFSTLNEMRKGVLQWVNFMFRDLADKNGFSNTPIVHFLPISAADMSSLVSIAVNAVKEKIISKDTLARIFGSSYEEENPQIIQESIDQKDLMEQLYPDLTVAPNGTVTQPVQDQEQQGKPDTTSK